MALTLLRKIPRLVTCALLFAASTAVGGPQSATPATAHFAVTTTSPQAQRLFDEGLTLYVAYNGAQAVHSFEQAAKLDPHLAMAQWGEALAYGPDINVPFDKDRFEKGKKAAARAAALAGWATLRERAYIAAMSRRYAGKWNDADAESAYRAAMRALADADTSDLTALALYAEALLESTKGDLWNADGSAKGPATTELTQLVARALQRDPGHLLANHVCVHLYDEAQKAAAALPCADRLNSLAYEPAAEHLAHMPAHTYIDLGRYQAAAQASDRAIVLFDRYLATPGIDRFHEGYERHDLRVGWSARMMLGNYSAAHALAKRIESLATSPGTVALTKARFARWSDILAGADPAHSSHAQLFALALANVASGDLARAAGARDTLRHEKADEYANLIAGKAAVREHRLADALQAFSAAQVYQDANYFGELIPVFPAGEALGGAYLQMGRAAEAEKAFRKTLVRLPNDPRALFGLAQALKMQNKFAEARAVQAEFAALWQGSDTRLNVNDL